MYSFLSSLGVELLDHLLVGVVVLLSRAGVGVSPGREEEGGSDTIESLLSPELGDMADMDHYI